MEGDKSDALSYKNFGMMHGRYCLAKTVLKHTNVLPFIGKDNLGNGENTSK